MLVPPRRRSREPDLDRLTFLFYICSVLTDALALPENRPDADLRARSLAQLDRLDELAEIGMKAARRVGERADNAGPEEDLNALAMAYARAARAVRQCVLLHAKVVKDLRDGDRADREDAEGSEAERREDRKVQVENLVYRKAERVHGDDHDAIERLMNEACERLDDEDMFGELMTRPVPDMVEELCRDLGLDAPAPPKTIPPAVAASGLVRGDLTEAQWCDALIKATAEAEKALAELRPDSS